MVNEIINEKIEILKSEEPSRYKEFLSRLSDIAEDNLKRYGFKNLIDIPAKEKVYHGFQFKYLVAVDKASNDRWEAVVNMNHRVSLINDENSNLPLIQNNLKYMLDKCLNVENNSEKSTMELLLKYILYSLGDKQYIELDEGITDTMVEIWYEELKLAWLIFNPCGLILNSLGFDYFGMGFNNFINSNKHSIEELLLDSNFNNQPVVLKLALKVEIILFAPYMLKNFNKIVTI